jgi:hypothetical protein
MKFNNINRSNWIMLAVGCILTDLLLTSSILIDRVQAQFGTPPRIDCKDAPNLLKNGNFESYELSPGVYSLPTSPSAGNPWVREGRAGLDIRQGFGMNGSSNAWARDNKGWNAIRQSVALNPLTTYVLSGYVRTSPSLKSWVYRLPYANVHGEPFLTPSDG